MNTNEIKTDAEYQRTLQEIDSLMIAKVNSPEGEKLDALVTQVKTYETKNFQLGLFRNHNNQV